MKIDEIKLKGAAVIVALCLFVFIFGRSSVCLIRGAVGIPCPGCGMTRALYSALSMDFRQAFLYHPLWPLVPPAAVYALYCFFRGKKINGRLVLAAGILLVAVYAVRMVLMFPGTEPMTFNHNAVYVRLYRLLTGAF